MNSALEIAKQTIMQSQIGINVSMNNISGSKIHGYTRQQVNLRSGVSIPGSTSHLLGTGAKISGIDRLRSGFYDTQFRDNIGIYSNASVMSMSLKKVETFFGSIDGDTGVKTGLGDFFNALEELSKSPENIGMKQILVDSASSLAQSFNQVSTNLNTMKEQYAGFIESKVADINGMLKDLDTLNTEIGKSSALGQTPNDLLDERDRLLDELSANMDISVVHTQNNQVNIISNGKVLLQDGFLNQLSVDIKDGYNVEVTYSDGSAFSSSNGELSALIKTSSDIIPKYQDKINSLAKDFMDAFNKIHSSGMTANGEKGVNFFEGTDAGSIKVSDVLLKDPSKVVTSSDGTAGNNDIALSLIGLKSDKVIGGGEYSVFEFYDNISATISAETKATVVKEANYKYISKEIYTMRSNEIGVNEDEELLAAANYQKTFAAASKIIKTLDDMFSSLMQAI